MPPAILTARTSKGGSSGSSSYDSGNAVPVWGSIFIALSCIFVFTVAGILYWQKMRTRRRKMMQRKKEAAAAVAAAAVAVASAGGVAVDEAHGDERAMIKTSRTEDGDSPPPYEFADQAPQYTASPTTRV